MERGLERIYELIFLYDVRGLSRRGQGKRMLRDWDSLPDYMKNDKVRFYYDRLKKKKFSLAVKRVFDIIASFFLLILLVPAFIIISVLIAADSSGGIFFCQERITQYGRKFRIFKFRTMVSDAHSRGSLVTVDQDKRVTKIGHTLRKYRLDEMPQLINVFLGDMSFVGTRPEVTKYVKRYTPEMMATLLLPAGITSECSIRYKDEDRLLRTTAGPDIDEIYVKQVLPGKMKYNLEGIENFSCLKELSIMVRTVLAVLH